MDLSVFVVMFVATLLVLVGLYFFLMKPLAGKSYEEIQKEKREMREKIMGTGSTASNAKSSKDNANKKAKKVNKKPQQQQQKQKPVPKDSDQDSAEASTESNESEFEEEINPLTYAKKKINASVEYAETEAFALNSAEGHGKKKDKQQQQNQGGGKNKNNKHGGGGKGGILLNKSEPVLVKQESAPEINHFEEIHPKDALEIARQHKEEEAKKSHPKEAPAPAAATAITAKKEEKSHPKDQRKQKGGKDAKPTQTKTSAVEEIPVVPAAVTPVVSNPVAAAPAPQAEVSKEKANVVNKDKSNKKKKNELITQQLAAEVHDAVNVQSLVRILGKADLPRNDIQILIDFLLNKQQDTLTKDPSEWNDPSDPLQKLKKQLQEK